MKSHSLYVVLLGIAGACAGPRPPSQQSWLARGDAALATDPGRALANYERAGQAAGPAKQRDAAIRWIRHELAQRRAKPDTPHADLSFAIDARRQARERKVEQDLAADLDAAEAAFADAWWKDELATIASRAPTPLEQLVYLAGVRAALPASAAATARDADSELRARRIQLFARYEQGRAESFAHPAAQALYDTLLAALQGGEPFDRRARESIARAARAAFAITADGCADLRSVTAAVPAGDGAHRVSIHVQATCNASEKLRDYTEREHWTTTRSETYYDTEMETVCTTSYETPTCTQRRYDGAYNGTCVKQTGGSSQSCKQVPKSVRKTRQIEIPHQGTYAVKERALYASVSGTFVIRVDSVEQRIPFNHPLNVIEKQYTNHTDSSSFSMRRPESLIGEVVQGPLTDDVKAIAERIGHELLDAHLETARTRLAAGDLRGAEAEVATALFAGAPALGPTFAPLAERAGMPLDTLASVLRTGTVALQRDIGLVGAALPRPEADRDLADAATAAELALMWKERERQSAELAAYDADQRVSVIGIGIDRWTALDDSTSHGLTVLWGHQRGGGGMGTFWMFEDNTALDLNVGLPGLGLDAHGRLGGGLRHPWISLAGYGAAGLSRRGVTASGDPGLPLSIDAGYGLQLVLGPTRSRRLELLAERLLRPFVDDPEMGVAIHQRLRYELRYVSREFIGENSGWRLRCAFDQTSTSDALFVGAPTTTRACAIAAFVAY